VPLPGPPNQDKLSETRYVTLILRLALDQQGYVKYGEVVEATNGFQEKFVKWGGLIHVLQLWHKNQSPLEPPDEP
jgi:hypothetical protein